MSLDNENTIHLRKKQTCKHDDDHVDENSSDSVDEKVNQTEAESKLLCRTSWDDLLQQTRDRLTSQFESQLEEALRELASKATCQRKCLKTFQWNSDYLEDKLLTKPNSDGVNKLPVKVFRHRDSVLTELFQLSHIRTVYHIFIAILALFSFNVICNDMFGQHNGTPADHVYMFNFAFGGFRDVFLFWLNMKAATLLIPFLGFLFWCTRRPHSPKVVFLDWTMMGFYILYQIAFLIIPSHFIITSRLPPASSAIVTMEQLRLFMKSHAFIRTSAEKIYDLCKSRASDPNGNTPHHHAHSHAKCWHPYFSHYLYFLFAPTLVYRESYPRTKEIRWGYVVSNMLQVCGCILLSYYVLVRFCFTEFVQFGKTSDYTFRNFILASTATSVPGGLVMLLTFFAALHSWLNAFAEMLRFGDRLFYKDWWNATSFSAWYRTWNVVVHDWLYTYLYTDILCMVRGPYARSVALACVFWISATAHEYALCLSLGFCFPVLFTFFVFFGQALVYHKSSSRGWNVLIWILLFTGWGQMMCLYSMEWYARKNCQPVFNSRIDFVIPHSWFCRPILANQSASTLGHTSPDL